MSATTTNQRTEVAAALREALDELRSARSAIEDAEWALQDAQKNTSPDEASGGLIGDLLLLHKQLARDSVFAPQTPSEFQERLAQILLAAQVTEVVTAV